MHSPASLSTCPPEILTSIFKEALSDFPPGSPAYSRQRTTLRCLSKHLKKVVDGDTQFWDSIDADAARVIPPAPDPVDCYFLNTSVSAHIAAHAEWKDASKKAIADFLVHFFSRAGSTRPLKVLGISVPGIIDSPVVPADILHRSVKFKLSTTSDVVPLTYLVHRPGMANGSPWSSLTSLDIRVKLLPLSAASHSGMIESTTAPSSPGIALPSLKTLAISSPSLFRLVPRLTPIVLASSIITHLTIRTMAGWNSALSLMKSFNATLKEARLECKLRHRENDYLPQPPQELPLLPGRVFQNLKKLYVHGPWHHVRLMLQGLGEGTLPSLESFKLRIQHPAEDDEMFDDDFTTLQTFLERTIGPSNLQVLELVNVDLAPEAHPILFHRLVNVHHLSITSSTLPGVYSFVREMNRGDAFSHEPRATPEGSPILPGLRTLMLTLPLVKRTDPGSESGPDADDMMDLDDVDEENPMTDDIMGEAVALETSRGVKDYDHSHSTGCDGVCYCTVFERVTYTEYDPAKEEQKSYF